MLKPIINTEKCNGCGNCVDACLRHGLSIENNVVIFVGKDDCTWCGDCEAVCPKEAIACPYDIVTDK